jgi:citrate synthase
MDKPKAAATTNAGLRGVAAASSSISDVNGEKGELIYQGYNIHDLATKSTFEEVIFLLWNARLPKRAELDELRKNIAASCELPERIVSRLAPMRWTRCVRSSRPCHSSTKTHAISRAKTALK